MRTRLSAIALLALITTAVGCASSEIEGTVYGEELTLTETTPISEILADPESYVGQRVLVEATIVNVCEMRGCWLEMAGGNDFEKIRIKVEDGVIVFPMSAKGLRARAEGIVEKIEMTEEEAIEQAKHQAEEHGTEFDPSTVTGPRLLVCASGIGGWGESDRIRTRCVGDTFYLVGDERSEVSAALPPTAAIVGLAAAKQADVVVERILRERGREFEGVRIQERTGNLI